MESARLMAIHDGVPDSGSLPGADVLPQRSSRASLEVSLTGTTPEAPRAHLATLLRSPLGVYISHTEVLHDSVRVRLDIAPEDLDFTLHMLQTTLPDTTIGTAPTKETRSGARTWSGIWLPLVTPFRAGEVDVEALRALTEHYVGSGIAGFVALGTTGEAALLSESERATVMQTICDTVAGRLPVLAGVGGVDTREFVRQIQSFERWDVTGFLVSAPAYLCPTQAGIEWHFQQIAHATKRPIVIYDVPHRTGVSIEPETVRRLAALENVVAIKACASQHFGALGNVPINVLCGTDEAFLDCLISGGHGGILASAHVCADLLIEVQALMQAGKAGTACHLFTQLRPVLKLLFAAPNPSAIKAMLALDGLIHDEVRMPVTPVPDSLREQLIQARRVLQELRSTLPIKVA
jgi:4-hydroxy-tetrahydrodipicolinate synthase